MANFDYPQSFVLEDTNTGVLVLPLDNYFDCRAFSVFDPAGCNIPQVPTWCFPFTPDDYIFIQTNIAPSLVEFFELDGTPQAIPFVQDGKTIYIDAANIPSFINCFYLKLDGECTYTYTREKCPQNTVSVESAYQGKDPLGFDYSASFVNFARMPGGFESIGLRTEETADSLGRLVTRKTFERYALKSIPMPADVWRYYANILGGKDVKVNKDGFSYNLVSLAEKRGRNGLFQIDAVLERFQKKNIFC